jgi:hypothetical protein
MNLWHQRCISYTQEHYCCRLNTKLTCTLLKKIVYLHIFVLEGIKPITLSAPLKHFTQESVEGSLKLRSRINKIPLCS